MPLDFLVIIPLFQIQLVLQAVEGPQMRTSLDESASFDGTGVDGIYRPAQPLPAYPPDRRGRASYNEFDERAGPRECRPVVGALVVFLRLLFPLLL
jgi:hypothetical protein